jgi:hypothetical protein
MQTVKQAIVIKPCSVAELAALYGVSVKIMRRWLNVTEPYTGKRRGRFYTAMQVATILRRLGVPGATEMTE